MEYLLLQPPDVSACNGAPRCHRNGLHIVLAMHASSSRSPASNPRPIYSCIQSHLPSPSSSRRLQGRTRGRRRPRSMAAGRNCERRGKREGLFAKYSTREGRYPSIPRWGSRRKSLDRQGPDSYCARMEKEKANASRVHQLHVIRFGAVMFAAKHE